MLSASLIAGEVFVLPLAVCLDVWGALQGTDLVRDSFVSMRETPRLGRAPRYRGVMPLQGYLSETRALLATPVAQVPGRVEALIARLEAREAEADAHLALAVHVLESVGLAARNALPRPSLLGRVLVRSQILGLLLAPPLDWLAQRMHRRGVAMVVDDVPAIPRQERG